MAHYETARRFFEDKHLKNNSVEAARRCNTYEEYLLPVLDTSLPNTPPTCSLVIEVITNFILFSTLQIYDVHAVYFALNLSLHPANKYIGIFVHYSPIQ